MFWPYYKLNNTIMKKIIYTLFLAICFISCHRECSDYSITYYEDIKIFKIKVSPDYIKATGKNGKKYMISSKWKDITINYTKEPPFIHYEIKESIINGKKQPIERTIISINLNTNFKK